jgi:hypothetical protein
MYREERCVDMASLRSLFQFAGAGANAIVAATPTSFAAGGSFAATLDLGKGTMTSNGGYDLWIADFAR